MVTSFILKHKDFKGVQTRALQTRWLLVFTMLQHHVNHALITRHSQVKMRTKNAISVVQDNTWNNLVTAQCELLVQHAVLESIPMLRELLGSRLAKNVRPESNWMIKVSKPHAIV